MPLLGPVIPASVNHQQIMDRVHLDGSRHAGQHALGCHVAVRSQIENENAVRHHRHIHFVINFIDTQDRIAGISAALNLRVWSLNHAHRRLLAVSASAENEDSLR